MIAAIMQPYFFPYIGYFQLMAHCDVFVAFDDAQYIRRGWINRNRILVKETADWLTYPVAYADHSWPINRRSYLASQRPKLLRRLEGAYRRAPHFARTMALVEQVFAFGDSNLATFNINLLRTVATALDIQVPMLRASDMKTDPRLAGRDIVVEICRRVGATQYVNPIGGIKLYDFDFFASHGISLAFLRPTPREYEQFGNPFVGALSIIDVLMFNDISAVKAMLDDCRLLRSQEDLRAAGLEIACR